MIPILLSSYLSSQKNSPLIIYAFGPVFALSGLSQVVFIQSSVHSSILIQDVRLFSLPVQVLSFNSKPLLQQVVIRLPVTIKNERPFHLFRAWF